MALPWKKIKIPLQGNKMGSLIVLCTSTQMNMHSSEEIKKEAFRQLNQLPGGTLKDLTEIEINVTLPAVDNESTYTVFFERAHTGDKDEWAVRNIIRPDKLQKPQDKADGKVE